VLKQVKCLNPINLVLKSWPLVSLAHIFIGIYDPSYLWGCLPLCPQQKTYNCTTLSMRDVGGQKTLKISHIPLGQVDLTGVLAWPNCLPRNLLENGNAVVINMVSPKNDSYDVISCSEAAWLQDPSTQVPFLFCYGLCLLNKHRSMYRMEALPTPLLWLWGQNEALAEEFLVLKPLAELIWYSYYLHLHFWGEMSTNALVLKDGNLHFSR